MAGVFCTHGFENYLALTGEQWFGAKPTATDVNAIGAVVTASYRRSRSGEWMTEWRRTQDRRFEAVQAYYRLARNARGGATVPPWPHEMGEAERKEWEAMLDAEPYDEDEDVEDDANEDVEDDANDWDEDDDGLEDDE